MTRVRSPTLIPFRRVRHCARCRDDRACLKMAPRFRFRPGARARSRDGRLERTSERRGMDERSAESASSLDKTARKLTDDIQRMSNYRALYSEIQVSERDAHERPSARRSPRCLCFFFLFFSQRLVASPAVDKDDFKNSLIAALKDNGLETEIRNTVFHWARSRVLPPRRIVSSHSCKIYNPPKVDPFFFRVRYILGQFRTYRQPT